MTNVSDLNGKKVITTDAFTIGAVSGVEVDTTQWKITHLHISLNKEATAELGYKKPVFGHITICIPIALIKAFGDVATLNKTREELTLIPECKYI